MKKLAIGCGVVLLFLAVGVSVGSYLLYNKARSYFGPLQELAGLDKNIANTATFTPPPKGQLSAELVKRFAAVQDAMHARLGGRIEEAKEKEDEFMRRQAAEHREASASENFTVITDLMKVILQAKNAWVDALNEQQFSIDEYYWVRGQVYAAAGMTLSELSLRKMSDTLKEGGALTRPVTESSGSVPERNRELVKPYLPKMRDWAVIAFFGL